MLIYPDIQATPDSPTIKFYQPREQIDLNKELPRILHAQGWGCGTLFNVMFLNHEKTKLLACGRFVVTEEVESLHTNDANPYQPMTRTVFSRCAEQIGGWWPESLNEQDDRQPSQSAGPTPEAGHDGTESGMSVATQQDARQSQVSTETSEGHRRRGRPPKAA